MRSIFNIFSCSGVLYFDSHCILFTTYGAVLYMVFLCCFYAEAMLFIQSGHSLTLGQTHSWVTGQFAGKGKKNPQKHKTQKSRSLIFIFYHVDIFQDIFILHNLPYERPNGKLMTPLLQFLELGTQQHSYFKVTLHISAYWYHCRNSEVR